MRGRYLCKAFVVIHLSKIVVWYAEAVTNVALNKDGIYCSVKQNIAPLFDGDLSVDKTLEMRQKCPNVALVTVNLVEKYSVQYVVVHSGEGTSENQLTSFGVTLGASTFCAEYASKVTAPGEILRVNCRPNHNLFSDVTISSTHNDGFFITEIEVFTLASGLPSVPHILSYRGCFKTFGSKPKPIGWENCHQKCRKGGYIFAAVKDKKQCSCANELSANESLPVKECNVHCKDGVNYCGSKEAFSVYVVTIPLPYFGGCYSSVSSTSTVRGSMTVMKCLRHCDNFSIATLQNYDQCLCTDVKPQDENYEKSFHCGGSCSGAEYQELCGTADHAAAYYTCKHSRNHISCSEFFRCKNREFDMYGSCGGKCEQDFTGEYCFELDFREGKMDDGNIFNKDFLKLLDMFKIYILFASPLLLCVLLACCLSSKSEGESTSS